MLDNGANHTFITNRKAKSIGANFLGKQWVSNDGCGTIKRVQELLNVWEFEIKLLNGDCRAIKAYGKDIIICSINKYAIDPSCHPLLTRMRLADEVVDRDQLVPIDLLIGGEYHYDLVKPERILNGYLVRSWTTRISYGTGSD